MMFLMYTKVMPFLFGTEQTVKAALKRIAFTSTIMTFFSISVFLFSISLLEGHTVDYAIEEVKLKLWFTVKRSWQFWPMMSFINFRFVPPMY